MNECYSLELTESLGAFGLGYMRYKADSLVVRLHNINTYNVIYNYVSESYFFTAGYSDEYFRYVIRVGYGIETQNQAKYRGILLDNSFTMEIPVWIFKIGAKLGIGGIANLKETYFPDINYYYGIVFGLRTKSN